MKFTCKTSYTEMALHEALCDAERLHAIASDDESRKTAECAMETARALLVEKLLEKCQAFSAKIERDNERNREREAEMQAEWEKERSA